MSAAERASEASDADQVNEWAEQANGQASEWPSTSVCILGYSGP